MEQWKEYKLGEILTIKYGKDHKRIVDGNIPIYGSGGIMRYGERSIYDGPSILIPRKGSLNNVMFVDKPFWTVDTMFWSIINEDIANPLFVYYSICKKDFASFNVGSAVPSLTVPIIEDIDILLPSKVTQDKVVAVLKSLDDKIELNRRINDNLEQQAQALFKSWFVDFEPFKDGEFVDSELGMIPKGWRVGTLSDIIHFESGFAFKSDSFCENGQYRLITIKGVQDGRLDINGAVCIDSLPSRMPNYCLLSEGDIIMSLTGNVGRCCIVDRQNLLLNQRVVKLRPVTRNNSLFVYSMFRREGFKEKLISLSRGTAQANLSPIETANLKAIIPNNDTISKFSYLGEFVFSLLLNNIKETNVLVHLRDTLLPRLMSGELKINDLNC